MENDRVNRAVAAIGQERESTLEQSLVKFAHILRRLGLRVSTAETRDAFDALSKVDLLDRAQVKGALAAALVKSYYDRQVFDTAFDLYFVPPEVREGRMDSRRERIEERERELARAGEELAGGIKEGGREWVQEMLERLRLTEEQKETYARLPEKEKKRLTGLFARMDGNPVNSPSELIARTLEGSLEYWRHQLEKGKEGGDAPGTAPSGIEEFDEVIEAVSGVLAGGQREDRIMNEDMKDIADRDLPRVNAVIRKLARQLATRISRRYHRSRKRDVLDFRRTVRGSVRYGGAMVELKHRSRRVQKPRIILICDVSQSMARYARFVIQFIYGLSNAVKGIESFIFSEDLEHVSPYFKAGRSFSGIMTALINGSRQWGRATNLHASLTTFLNVHSRLLTPDTFVIILSDAKTIAGEEAAGDLAVIRERVREMIWLNTLPRREWKNLPGIALFRKYCRMFECYTLAHLNKVLKGRMLAA
ncbi:MAG: VWA domain-containing protein [Firmicutes bacterium]|nr:VWA domain-containing protein [Bacillota bacterium]